MDAGDAGPLNAGDVGSSDAGASDDPDDNAHHPEKLILELVDTLAVAIRLHDAGESNDTIATALGVPVESVPSTLRVAEAKIAERRGVTGG